MSLREHPSLVFVQVIDNRARIAYIASRNEGVATACHPLQLNPPLSALVHGPQAQVLYLRRIISSYPTRSDVYGRHNAVHYYLPVLRSDTGC